jgi:hypothetical protein
MTTASGNESKTVEKTIETIQKLVTLAVTEEDGQPTEEARTAAVTAAKMIHDNELVCVPKADMDRALKLVEGARDLARRTKAEGQKNMLIGAALGFFVGGGKLMR